MSYYKIKGCPLKNITLKPKDKKKKIKKKIKSFSECNICFNNVEDCMDNTICCGKVKHTICRDCKVNMKGDNCPMCRSHSVKQPIAQDINLKIIKKNKSDKSKSQILTPKKRRNYRRNNPYDEPFGPNSNRLSREGGGYSSGSAIIYIRGKYYIRSSSRNYLRRNRTSYQNRMFMQNPYSFVPRCVTMGERFRNLHNIPDETRENYQWLSEEDVLRYNGSLQTEYDSASDTSDDTLSLTDETIIDEDIHIPTVQYDSDEYGEVVEYILGINHI